MRVNEDESMESLPEEHDQAAFAAGSTHLSCSVCRTIPDRSRGFWKGGETLENTLPATMDSLRVVGAPFYDTDTSSSHHCLLQCPECGAVYAWDFEYEYLAGGSEDDIALTRLSREDGEIRKAAALEAVARHHAWFAREAPSRLDAILTAPADSRELEEAADFLFMEGPRRGADVAAAVPTILSAITRVGEESEAGSTLELVLFSFGTLGREQLLALRGALDGAGLAVYPRWVSLIQSCENTLRAKAGGDVAS